MLGLGFRGPKICKKKRTSFVPNQLKAVLMDHQSVLNCFKFEPSVLLSVLYIYIYIYIYIYLYSISNIDRGEEKATKRY